MTTPNGSTLPLRLVGGVKVGHLVAEPVQRDGGDCGGRGGARSRVEQRQLAEHLARPEHGEQVLTAVSGGAAELHLALAHDVEAVTGVPLGEERLPAADRDLVHPLPQRGLGLVVEGGEER